MPVFSLGLVSERTPLGRWAVTANWLDGEWIYGETWEECYWRALKAYNDYRISPRA